MKYIDMFGVHISSTNVNSACETIERWIINREKTYICVAPASTIVDCQRNKEYLKIVNNAGMVTPDGMPLVWLGKLKGDRGIQRTYGPDLMLALCEISQKKGYKHYLYGGSPCISQLLEAGLKERFSDLNIVGRFSPPTIPIHAEESAEVIEEINRADPDVLWVGLGSPKQDFWMYRHREKLNVPVMIGIGAAFDFIAGTKRQAPKWMQKSGLEWLFRLITEPRRLWKRYILGNSIFIYLICKELISGRLLKEKIETRSGREEA